jgi:hypothetical protein
MNPEHEQDLGNPKLGLAQWRVGVVWDVEITLDDHEAVGDRRHQRVPRPAAPREERSRCLPLGRQRLRVLPRRLSGSAAPLRGQAGKAVAPTELQLEPMRDLARPLQQLVGALVLHRRRRREPR